MHLLYGLLISLAAATVGQDVPAAEIAAVKVLKSRFASANRGYVGSLAFLDKKSAHANIPNIARTWKRRSHQVEARQDEEACAVLPPGSGPVISPDTPEAFVSSATLAQAAGAAPQPAHFVQTFGNLNGSIPTTDGYVGEATLDSYDTDQCAALCNAKEGCYAFNIYFKRSPSQSPSVNCPNPPSTTVITCAFFGIVILQDQATYKGEQIANFQVVIAGSNGYIGRGATGYIPGYNGTFSNEAAVNAPSECGTYIGYKFFTEGNFFDYDRCGAACDNETAYKIRYLDGRAVCRFFNTYVLFKNGVPLGQYCALYTRTWDITYATNYGFTYQNNTYSIVGSGLFSNQTDPGPLTCDKNSTWY